MYYLAGTIAHFVLKSKLDLCNNCKQILAPREWTDVATRYFDPVHKINFQNQIGFNLTPQELKNEAEFTQIISREGLIFVSSQVFNFIVYVESYIRSNLISHILKPNIFKSIFSTIVKDTNLPVLPDCCKIKLIILQRTILIFVQRILHKLFNSELKPQIIPIENK